MQSARFSAHLRLLILRFFQTISDAIQNSRQCVRNALAYVICRRRVRSGNAHRAGSPQQVLGKTLKSNVRAVAARKLEIVKLLDQKRERELFVPDVFDFLFDLACQIRLLSGSQETG